ncbi:MAG TPA: phosphotransferase [Frankiaceae bacterium]|nr:phosphotransferase [Frankiaceae bacterium]
MLGQGVRLPWGDIPAPVRAGIASVAGGAVVGAETCAGGFSPGAAARLTLDGGGTAFVKAVSAAQNPLSPGAYREEAVVNGWLPAHPALPRLLGTYDDGEWVALVFECVDAGTPSLPWVRSELSAVLRALVSVQAAGTPVPAEARPIAELFEDDFGSWRTLAASPVEGLDAWTLANLDRLASLEAGWAAAASGDTLVHADVRADNVLVRGGSAWIVDWPWACAGAGWVDGVLFAPSVSLQGGPAPEELMAAAYPDAPCDGVLAVLAAVAGFFTLNALQPAPQGLPTLRAHQDASGRACREWLARLLG